MSSWVVRVQEKTKFAQDIARERMVKTVGKRKEKLIRVVWLDLSRPVT